MWQLTWGGVCGVNIIYDPNTLTNDRIYNLHTQHINYLQTVSFHIILWWQLLWQWWSKTTGGRQHRCTCSAGQGHAWKGRIAREAPATDATIVKATCYCTGKFYKIMEPVSVARHDMNYITILQLFITSQLALSLNLTVNALAQSVTQCPKMDVKFRWQNILRSRHFQTSKWFEVWAKTSH